MEMSWSCVFHPKFKLEFDELPEEVQDELLARVVLLEACGPRLKRPHADTLGGSRHANMKELRFEADGGVWRVAYAFDTVRQGILLVAGDKSGGSQKRFYKKLIAKADDRFDEHLAAMKEKRSDDG